MWKALTYLFHKVNDHIKLALKEKLQKINMEKGNTIAQYLSKVTQFQNELGSVGIIVFENDLINMSLLGLPKICHN